MQFRITYVAVFLVLALASACGDRGGSTDRLQVVATVYPLGYFAERIGGDRVEVNVLVGPGLEAHGFEPTSSDLLALGDADVIVMNGIGLEPWLNGAIDALGNEVEAIVVEAADPSRAMEGEVHSHGEEEGDHDEDEGDHGDEDADGEGDHGDEDADENGDHGDEAERSRPAYVAEPDDWPRAKSSGSATRSSRRTRPTRRPTGRAPASWSPS